jgi:predicted metalloendopeptidase
MFYVVGIGALFGFGIEGDVGVDPNNMVLWFSQPQLGLPSKVILYLSLLRSSDTTIGIL